MISFIRLAISLGSQAVIIWIARQPSGVALTDLPLIVIIDAIAIVVFLLCTRIRDLALNAARPLNRMVIWVSMAVFLLTPSLLGLNVPLRVGFLISRRSMENMVATTKSHDGVGSPLHVVELDQWAGVYSVSAIAFGKPNAPTELFIKTYPWYAGSATFIYSPKIHPPKFDVDLGNGWYAYRRYFSWT